MLSRMWFDGNMHDRSVQRGAGASPLRALTNTIQDRWRRRHNVPLRDFRPVRIPLYVPALNWARKRACGVLKSLDAVHQGGRPSIPVQLIDAIGCLFR